MKRTAKQRIERVVQKAIDGDELFNRLTGNTVINLILAERARLKREVRRCQCDPEDGAAVAAGYAQAKHDILARWET